MSDIFVQLIADMEEGIQRNLEALGRGVPQEQYWKLVGAIAAQREFLQRIADDYTTWSKNQ